MTYLLQIFRNFWKVSEHVPCEERMGESKWLSGEDRCTDCGWRVSEHPVDTDCKDALAKTPDATPPQMTIESLAEQRRITDLNNESPASSLNAPTGRFIEPSGTAKEIVRVVLELEHLGIFDSEITPMLRLEFEKRMERILGGERG